MTLNSKDKKEEIWEEAFKEKFCLRNQLGIDITPIVIDYIKRYINSQERERIKELEEGIREALPELVLKRDIIVVLGDSDNEEANAGRAKRLAALNILIDKLRSLIETKEKL